jgi:ceramide glucosyltransferase
MLFPLVVQSWNLILAGLAGLSCCLVLWQWLAARTFPLHQKANARFFTPGVSVLKPLKGCDETTETSLRSWFAQEYGGNWEILLGVADARDPVCKIVQRLIEQNPGVPARLVVCEHLTGTNSKVAKLARLQHLAAHGLILISDADVRVPPDFIGNIVAPLRNKKTALVNCFYRLANPTTTALQWEAVAINADFWSQVLQSKMLKPMNFALGAAILVRRRALEEIGGFASLADCLADDYQLGRRIADHGHSLALCSQVVECWDSPKNWQQVWNHQLRWARTIRVCQPGPYFFSILSNGSLWPAILALAALGGGNLRFGLLAAGLCIGLRILLAQDLQRRFTPNGRLVSPFWLVPTKDFAQAILWLAAFLGTSIEWRGRRMRVRRDGTLLAVDLARSGTVQGKKSVPVGP